MFISCKSCYKKFDIDEKLIPEKGRLLQCSNCNHKWFFKNDIAAKTIVQPVNNELKIFENKEPNENNSAGVDNSNFIHTEIAVPADTIIKKKKINKIIVKKNYKFLNLTIVFIISFIALVIFLDTFESILSKIFPNFKFLLNNLYESIKDIELFIKDLI